MTITMWRLCVSLLFLELQTVEGTIGVEIKPCTDSFVEVPAEGSLTLNCTPKTQSMEWRLSLEGQSYLLAKFQNNQYVDENTFYNTFVASSDQEKLFLKINSNKTRNISQVNGTVICQDLTQSSSSSSNCGLNFVYRPKPSDISCTASADPDADRLYCTINNIYSSRGIYTCQASRQEKQNSQKEELNTVNMVTRTIGGGQKVSGECNITTKLPEEAGNYTYTVKISPGELEVLAKLPDGGKYIEHYRPKESDISCIATAEYQGTKLYCTINIHSSRGVYTCQAFRKKLEQNSQKEELNTVNMTTSNDAGGRTMTGKCIITTKLPVNAGNYTYGVKISPGRLEVQAKLPDGGKYIEHFGTGTAVATQAAIYNVLTVWLVAAFVL